MRETGIELAIDEGDAGLIRVPVSLGRNELLLPFLLARRQTIGFELGRTRQ